ncbi:MAG: hypothetical protein IJ057_06275 [Bacteroidales bacterium]|nr:hypothetical protein [Bacteroidales bacterium]
MSFIGESRKGNDRQWELVLALEESDCKALLKTIQRIAIHDRKNYEKWKDIHDGGEMTTRQETVFIKAEERMEITEALFDNIKVFLKRIAQIEEHNNQILKGATP